MEEYGVPYGVLTPQCQQANHGLISGINKQFAEELRNRHIDYRLILEQLYHFQILHILPEIFIKT